MQNKNKLVLYHYWRSSCSWRVRWGLQLKGVKYDSVTVNLLKNEHLEKPFLNINPSGTVPCLVANGLVMTESFAILEWLEEAYQSGTQLMPSTPSERFRVRQISNMIVSGIQPIQNLKVLRYVSDDQSVRNSFAKHWIKEGLKPVENTLTSVGSAGSYCLGSQLSIADLCLIPQIYNAIRFNVDLNEFPTSKRIYESCMRLPSCVSAAPEQQLDAIKA